MTSPAGVVTYLFTDIEGSTRLWEEAPERMRVALARHDALAREAVAAHAGTLVKTTGDGIHAAFDDPLDAVEAALALQFALATESSAQLQLDVRCGVHMGPGERRDGDFYGPEVNRAARIMGAAHGGQVLVSQPVALLVGTRLRDGAALRALGELRLRDIAGTEQVFQLLHPRLRAQFPPLRSLASTPTNLPQQLTSFVGREAALAEVVEHTRRTRLVTLVGPGGIGKTRLSLEAAASMLDAFPDGVFVVELAPIGDARLVAQAVATVLGVKEEAGKPVVEALMKHLAGRRMLLVLDNCEHLVQGCADLATAVLRASASLHILASSREALAIRGEQVYAVPALSLPAGPAPGSRARDEGASRRFLDDALRGSEAARLFIERAVAARADYEVAGEDGAAIIEICRRLDGIPLAIELAAARTRTMPVPRIAERLSDRFRLLTGGDRSAMPRQQTLRALIDWSYDLLDAPEQAVFRRLALFAGDFTLESAEQVVAGDDVDAADVVDLVAHLADKSLVMADTSAGRYALLETVRQYAEECLRAAPEHAEVRQRYLEHYDALASEARAELMGPHQGEWLSRLDLEHDNLLAVLGWHEGGEAADAARMRIAEAIKFYWFSRGLLELGKRVAVEVLARAPMSAPPALRGPLLLAAGQFALWQGNYPEADRHLRESVAIARAGGDPTATLVALQPLGFVTLALGDATAAAPLFEEALALARKGGDPRQIASALNQLGQLDRMRGDAPTAASRFSEALPLARVAGNAGLVAIVLLNAAMVEMAVGRVNGVARMLLEALGLAVETGNRPAVQAAFDAGAGLASMLDEPAAAARFLGTAASQLDDLGTRRDPVDADFLAPRIQHVRRALGEEGFAAEETRGRALDDASALADLRAWLERREAAPGRASITG